MLLILIESLPTLGQEKDADLRAGQKHGLVNVVQNHEFGMLVPDGTFSFGSLEVEIINKN